MYFVCIHYIVVRRGVIICWGVRKIRFCISVVAVFILLSALFSFLSQALIVEKSKTERIVSISDCADFGISMSAPPDMESHPGNSDTFIISGNVIDRNLRTDSYFGTFYNEQSIAQRWVDGEIACMISERTSFNVGSVVMIC